MTDASTEDEIDSIIDKPVNSCILNGCGWCITTGIVPSNKLYFLQHLLLDEVISKREKNLKAFLRGLDVLGIGEIVKRHPAMAKKMFVMEDIPMTPDAFMKVVASLQPKKAEEIVAYGFFKDFVSSLGGQLYTFMCRYQLKGFLMCTRNRLICKVCVFSLLSTSPHANLFSQIR